jgi:hypothetical protein
MQGNYLRSSIISNKLHRSCDVHQHLSRFRGAAVQLAEHGSWAGYRFAKSTIVTNHRELITDH